MYIFEGRGSHYAGYYIYIYIHTQAHRRSLFNNDMDNKLSIKQIRFLPCTITKTNSEEIEHRNEEMKL